MAMAAAEWPRPAALRRRRRAGYGERRWRCIATRAQLCAASCRARARALASSRGAASCARPSLRALLGREHAARRRASPASCAGWPGRAAPSSAGAAPRPRWRRRWAAVNSCMRPLAQRARRLRAGAFRSAAAACAICLICAALRVAGVHAVEHAVDHPAHALGRAAHHHAARRGGACRGPSAGPSWRRQSSRAPPPASRTSAPAPFRRGRWRWPWLSSSVSLVLLR